MYLKNINCNNNNVDYMAGCLMFETINSNNFQSIQIFDSNFQNNYAGYYGGAVAFLEHPSIIINNINCDTNKAEYDGGCLYFENNDGDINELKISYSNFTNNYAESFGGSIQIYNSRGFKFIINQQIYQQIIYNAPTVNRSTEVVFIQRIQLIFS